MIPKNAITEWGEFAPWKEEVQIEQDLLICRALVEIYQDDFLSSHLAFRGVRLCTNFIFILSLATARILT